MTLQLGSHGPLVSQWTQVMLKRFKSYALGVNGLPLKDDSYYGYDEQKVQKEYERRTGQLQDGIVSDGDLEALGLQSPHPPTHVYFSVCGTGVPWNFGYPFDLGEAINKGVWSHQPIGYPAAAFPMRPSYTAGVTELVRQLDLYRCDQRTWGFGGYSQGAIVTSIVLQRILTGDLQKYKATFLGGITFGNPMREPRHTLPGGVDPGGSGIVLPNLVGTPDTVWDMASGKKMVGSKGNDLYCTCGSGTTAQAVKDQRAVWDIVDNKKITSLAVAILDLALSPTFSEGVGAAEAAFGALGFFGSGTAAHVNYQTLQPIAGDSRDSWRIALDHLNDIGIRAPVRMPIGVAA